MRRTLAPLLASLLVLAGLVVPAPAVAAVRWQPAKVYRIMPLGDSITRGVGDPYGRGYRMRLAQYLRAAGVKTNFVGSQRRGEPVSAIIRDPDHEGHGGYTIAELQRHAASWVRAARPDVVLLMAGTNDMIQDVAPATAHRRLARLIRTVRAARPGVVVFVSRLPGVHAAEPAVQRRINAFNVQVARLVATTPGVYLVDNSDIAAITNWDMMLWDRHHPNEYGYARIAYRFYRAMDAAFTGSWPRVSSPDLLYVVTACRHPLNPPTGCRRYVRDYAASGTIVWVRQ